MKYGGYNITNGKMVNGIFAMMYPLVSTVGNPMPKSYRLGMVNVQHDTISGQIKANRTVFQ